LKFAGSCRVSATFLLGIAKPGWAEDEEVREEEGWKREELELGCCVSKEKENEDGISTLLATEGRAGLIGVLQNHCAKLQNHSCKLSYCATLTGLPRNSTVRSCLFLQISVHIKCVIREA